ncbi:MAG: GtrA family protein [Frankiaceae bacterium]|nr:GtrA family protein [Frankiaceae bacterium]
MTKIPSASAPPEHGLARWPRPVRLLIKELAAFGVIGILNLVLDTALFNLLLAWDNRLGPNSASLISTSVCTLLAYLGNRHLSFSHRARTGFARETSYFFAVNIAALVAQQLIMAFFAYPLHYKHDTLVMNIVRLGTIGLGTVFRFWAYKRFVFLPPDKEPQKAAARYGAGT